MLLFFGYASDVKPLKPRWKPPFLPCLLGSIVLAALNPSIGRVGGPLRPEFTVNTLGVMLIFLISGVSLRVSQFAAAAFNWRANLFVQGFSFALFPAVFAAICTALRGISGGLVDARLLDGLLILGCLPTSINMCVVLTSRAQGDVALAIFNAVLSNAAGVVLTPLLLLAVLGKTLSLPLSAVLAKLSRRVILPLIVGLAAGNWGVLRRGFDRRRAYAALTSELLLLAVVYSTFCDAFGGRVAAAAAGNAAAGSGGGASIAALGGSAGLLASLPILYSVMALLSWFLTRRVLRLPARESVATTFCSTHKTLALGVPLIRTLFEGSPDVGWLTAPLLIWHPTQLIVGSFASSFLKGRVESEPQPPPEKLEPSKPPKAAPEYFI